MNTTDSCEKWEVILLHGVGADASQLRFLADRWQRHFPSVKFTAMEAPFAFDGAAEDKARQWYSLQDVDEENRHERVVAARSDFMRCLEEICGTRSRLVLVGFSQGGTMALDALMYGNWPLSAIVTFAARSALRPPYTPCPHAKALLIHGKADFVVPEGNSVEAAAILKAQGVETELALLPNVEHVISPSGVRLAERFLARLFGKSISE
ncbi:alpha/beta hydrolase [Kozakia baliensis]|uniref:Uncharacterized protein n=1 Tax=Kozakia baliensis TaxID=153496 RepID=A0A1D8USX0_9PROT|nr:prolyl oligopeptidase family serine peptidase [Kozakia baliensis]AOX16762.1 hypothetical protein A0U89_06030 [Kozakia baliensis]GBR31955.1 phospholipase [Kozakia baliensis NRIC 0488]GEL64689.1 phospholipase/carboxylesterase [Kozakia baliensis]